jgi:curved DNA-binding protein
VLGDPAKKAKYDAVESQYRSYTNSGQGRSWQDFGRSGSFRFNSEDFGDAFSGTSFGDLLSQLFGGGRTQGSARPYPQAAQQPVRRFEVSLTLDESLNGITKRFTIDGKKVDVNFRPGVADGQRLRIPEGEITVRISPHERYVRVGDDLKVSETVPITTAVLGGTIEVRTPMGAVTMTVPPATPNGKTFRLRNQGSPNYERPTVRGDMFVTLHVEVPSKLTPEQQVLMEQLKESGL